jgi:hypothetical protein
MMATPDLVHSNSSSNETPTSQVAKTKTNLNEKSQLAETLWLRAEVTKAQLEAAKAKAEAAKAKAEAAKAKAEAAKAKAEAVDWEMRFKEKSHLCRELIVTTTKAKRDQDEMNEAVEKLKAYTSSHKKRIMAGVESLKAEVAALKSTQVALEAQVAALKSAASR